MASYKKFEGRREESLEPIVASTISSSASASENGAIKKEPKRLRLYRGLYGLVLTEFLAGFIIFYVGIACTSLGTSSLQHRHAPSCVFGTGIWVGVLCMIGAGIGFFALRVPHGRKGLLVPYMVLNVFSCLADGVLIIFSALWISYNNFMWRFEGDHFALAALCFNGALIIIAFTHTVICITSLAFLCFNFCGKKDNIIIVYASPAASQNQNGDVSIIDRSDNRLVIET